MICNIVDLEKRRYRWRSINAVIDAPARMPQVYENAVVAIKECDRVDECKTWADKMEALASYARQALDDTLLKLATRIQARVGELLKEIEPSKGGRPAKETYRGAPISSRSQAARDAGLSTDQKNAALRVASIPPAEFEAAVESDKPPTVTELAQTVRRAFLELCRFCLR
jgi:hypothetical protein